MTIISLSDDAYKAETITCMSTEWYDKDNYVQ